MYKDFTENIVFMADTGEIMQLIKRSGCRMLCVGFEFGDQAILDAVEKGTTLDDMYTFAENAHRAGIRVIGANRDARSNGSIGSTTAASFSAPSVTSRLMRIRLGSMDPRSANGAQVPRDAVAIAWQRFERRVPCLRNRPQAQRPNWPGEH